jgi:hypothetical protein
MKFVLIFVAIIILLFSTPLLNAQNQKDSVLVRIETTDGNEYVGTVTDENDVRILFNTKNLGEISIQKSDIKSKEFLESSQVKDGEIWFANPQSTRYFWSPNGFGLKQGEGYYQNIWVLWNQFALGVTDNFSVGGAIVPLFLFGGAPTPIFATAKFSIPVEKEKINLATGVIAGTIAGESETGFGIVYGLSTFGTHDNNFTLGLGYGFGDGEWASAPLINASAMFRLSNRWYFLTENYYINIDNYGVAMISMGARSIIKKVAIDFGLFLPISEDSDFIALPWLGFSIPFGNTN